MAKQVDAREKELTHQVHREMLSQSLEQVKNLTPAVISGIKIFITAKEKGKNFTPASSAALKYSSQQKNKGKNSIMCNRFHKMWYQNVYHKRRSKVSQESSLCSFLISLSDEAFFT